MVTTYRLNGAGGPNSDCTPASLKNEQALKTITNTTATGGLVATSSTDVVAISWTTVSGEPGYLDWPNGNYIVSLDVRRAAVDSYKLQLVRVSSGCTVQETLGTSGSLTGTGVKELVLSGIDPSSGADTDRFQLRVLATNSSPSATKRLSASITEQSYIRGPWGPERIPPITMSKRLGRLLRM